MGVCVPAGLCGRLSCGVDVGIVIGSVRGDAPDTVVVVVVVSWGDSCDGVSCCLWWLVLGVPLHVAL